MINFYFYDQQLRSYLMQVCNIFSGLQVQTGKGTCGETEMMTVPVVLGSRDRVVAAIQAGNTKNRPFSLPTIAVNMSGISMSPNRKGINTVDSKTFLPVGGSYPEDLRVIQRVMPIPYVMSVDVSIYASNTDQMFQMLEQLLMLFDPLLQLQLSDAPFDWKKLTTIELISINNEENYPAGTEKRVQIWTLGFEVPIYIAPPADIQDKVVRKVAIQIGNMDGFSVNEFDDNGELVPFTEQYAQFEVTDRG